MFKVGIIGSDNSHAQAFAKLCNIPDPITGEYNFPDVRITAIYGHDPEQTKKVAEEGKIENIFEKPEDFFGKVDAVMVVFRHGNLHAKYALPFVKAGIPTWIDKPFTIDVAEAKMLIEEADKNKTLLTGGSTCKYNYDILMLQNSINSSAIGNLVSGYLNFPGDVKSEYGGIFFYGGHMSEMIMTIFGYDIKSVEATVKNDYVVAVANYDKFRVAMNFTKGAGQHFCILHGDKKSVVRELDISIIYKLGFAKFVEMLRTGKRPLPLEKLLAPTIFLNALNKSIETGREVFLSEIE